MVDKHDDGIVKKNGGKAKKKSSGSKLKNSKIRKKKQKISKNAKHGSKGDVQPKLSKKKRKLKSLNGTKGSKDETSLKTCIPDSMSAVCNTKPESDAAEPLTWKKPEGWSTMSKSKKRRLRKMESQMAHSSTTAVRSAKDIGPASDEVPDNNVCEEVKNTLHSSDGQKETWVKPAGWATMSTSKKRRLRKLAAGRRGESSGSLSNNNFAYDEDECVAPIVEGYNDETSAQSGDSNAIAEDSQIGNWVKPENWATMSKSKKRRLRKLEGDRLAALSKASEAATVAVQGVNPASGKMIKVKDHPMYRKYWRLATKGILTDTDLMERMKEANLNEALFGKWATMITLKGHGKKVGAPSKASRRRARQKRAAERLQKSASAEEKAAWDVVGATQQHSFKKGQANGTAAEADEAVRKIKKKKKGKKSVLVVNKAKTVYVSGLPHHVGVRKVRQYFKSCGAVAFVSMPTFEDTGLSRGIAQVTFTRVASAKRALELNGEYWGQRYLEITPSDGGGEQWKPVTEKPEGCETVFVGNLAYDITEDTLRDVFSGCGEITSIRWGTEKESGDFRGFGHVSFSESAAVDKAVALAGAICQGRPLKIDYASERERE